MYNKKLPGKIIGNVLGTKRRQNIPDYRNQTANVAGEYDVYLRDCKYGEQWDIIAGTVWDEEWDTSELALSKQIKMIRLAKQFMKKYGIKDPNYK